MSCPTSPLEVLGPTLPTKYSINSFTTQNGSNFSVAGVAVDSALCVPNAEWGFLVNLQVPSRTILFVDSSEYTPDPVRSNYASTTTTNTGYWHNGRAVFAATDGHAGSFAETDATSLQWFGSYTWRNQAP